MLVSNPNGNKFICFRCTTFKNTADFAHHVRTVPQHIYSHADLRETLLDVNSSKCILSVLYGTYNAKILCYKSFSENLVYRKSA
jgi:hypothetical protein